MPHDPSRATFIAAAAGAPLAVADRTAIDAVLRRPARHKQVIATAKVDGGAALRYAGNGLNAFEFALREGPGTLHVACVFYGPSLFLAANDALWGRYALFDVLDRAGDALPAIVHTPQNPFLHARVPLDFSIESLSRRGVSWLVCNNALHEVARQIAALGKETPESVYDDFRRNLVPGALIVPAGVAAVVLAQEAGFTFLPA